MNRRNFLLSSSALIISETVLGCGGIIPNTPPPATASVNMLQLAQAIKTQDCPEWCWAACISMIFTFHGHPVTQEEIVIGTYGGEICLPGMPGTITQDLTGPNFRDDNGKQFSSQVIAAYDYLNGINSLSNAQIINELNNNQPILYCNTHHAEVLYSATYTGSPLQPNIVEVAVIDPWPSNQRNHPLSLPEMVPIQLGGQMAFLAAVRVV